MPRSTNQRVKAAVDRRDKKIAQLEAKVAELILASDSLQSMCDQHNNERRAALDERSRARNAEREALKQRDEVLKENDALRGQLRERELDAERMRGYLDGIEDQKPVPQVTVDAIQRERKFGTYVDRSRMELRTGYGQERPRQWWERPR